MRLTEEVLEVKDHLDCINASLGFKTVTGDRRLCALVFYCIDTGKTHHKDDTCFSTKWACRCAINSINTVTIANTEQEPVCK